MTKLNKKFAVLGHPISHSLSPKIHQYFASQFSIDLDYQRIDVESMHFKKTLSDLKQKGYEGLNITLPLKNLAYEICDELSPRAEQTKSVNTISIKNDKLYGDTTDGLGLVTDLLTKNVSLENKKILVIGAGGASNGVMFDLISQQPQTIFLTNRTISKSHDMADYWSSLAKEKDVCLPYIMSYQKCPFKFSGNMALPFPKDDEVAFIITSKVMFSLGLKTFNKTSLSLAKKDQVSAIS